MSASPEWKNSTFFCSTMSVSSPALIAPCFTFIYSGFLSAGPMNGTILALLKQQLVHVSLWIKFWGNYSDQWLGFLILLLGSHFSSVSSLFFRISCQSLMVTFNHLQTELGASRSFSPSLLLGFFPSNLSEWHTLLTMLSIQHWQINWFQWFKSAINVSFPT